MLQHYYSIHYTCYLHISFKGVNQPKCCYCIVLKILRVLLFVISVCQSPNQVLYFNPNNVINHDTVNCTSHISLIQPQQVSLGATEICLTLICYCVWRAHDDRLLRVTHLSNNKSICKVISLYSTFHNFSGTINISSPTLTFMCKPSLLPCIWEH